MTARNKPGDKSPENRTSPRLATVDDESAGRRLDNFLLTELKGLPRSRIYRIIRSGEVRVNKGRAKPARRLESGDVVRIPPVRQVGKEGAVSVSRGKADWINQAVLYEDDALLAINKPSGLAVHGGSGISLGVIELLRAARPQARFLELVHRLDRDTSGCLLVAKKRSALRALHESFRDGVAKKYYQALLVGDWQGGTREVDLPLLTNQRRNGERYVTAGAGGKSARTRFFPLETYSGCVLTKVQLFTGRTHQIRVHAAAIGLPVAGDSKYGQEGGWRPPGLTRLFLHAERLLLPHPTGSGEIEFTAPLDERLESVLSRLRP